MCPRFACELVHVFLLVFDMLVSYWPTEHVCASYLIDERVPKNATEALIAVQQYHRQIQLCNTTDKSD